MTLSADITVNFEIITEKCVKVARSCLKLHLLLLLLLISQRCVGENTCIVPGKDRLTPLSQVGTYNEDRKLYVLTCDNGVKRPLTGVENVVSTMELWKTSSQGLKQDGLSMKNVCEGEGWDHGLLTKSIKYYNFVSNYLKVHSDVREKIHFLLVDGDTIWSTRRLKDIWDRYDCARGNKSILVSTEMGCWMGYFCNQNDTDLWYKDVDKVPTYSPFANSGIIMGVGSAIEAMLSFILVNNQSYYTFDRRLNVSRFHDQHAVGDYALRIAKDIVQLDYFQQFAGSFCVHVAHTKFNPMYKSVCKRQNGTIDYHCKDLSAQARNREPKYFKVDSSTCGVYRSINSGMNGYMELDNLAARPILWHGNGPGKRTYAALGKLVEDCWSKTPSSDSMGVKGSLTKPSRNLTKSFDDCPCAVSSIASNLAVIEPICIMSNGVWGAWKDRMRILLASVNYTELSEPLTNDGKPQCSVVIEILPPQKLRSDCGHKYICPESCLPVPYTALPVNWLLDFDEIARNESTRDTAITCSLTVRDMVASESILRQIAYRRVQECFEHDRWPLPSRTSSGHNITLTYLRAPSVPRRRVFGLIVWIGSITRLEMAVAQIEVLRGQHTSLAEDYFAGWIASEEQYPCRAGSGSCKQRADEIAHLLKRSEVNEEVFGWQCAQRRPLRALAHVLLLYDPEFVYLMDDDTFLNVRFLERGAPLTHYIRNKMSKKPKVIVYRELPKGGKITKHGIYYGGRGYLIGRTVIQRLLSTTIYGPQISEDNYRDRSQMKYLSILRESFQSLAKCPSQDILEANAPDDFSPPPCLTITGSFHANKSFSDYHSVAVSAVRLIDLCVKLMAGEHTCYHSDHAMTRCLAHGAYAEPDPIDCENSFIGRRGDPDYVEVGTCYYKYCSLDHSITCHRYVHNRTDLTGKGRAFKEAEAMTSREHLRQEWCST